MRALVLVVLFAACAHPPVRTRPAPVVAVDAPDAERIVGQVRALCDEVGAKCVGDDVCRVDGAVRRVVVVEVSPGGDWSSRAEHCFYPGGALAFRFEKLVSYQGHVPAWGDDGPSGPFLVEIRSYFDETGRQVRERKKATYGPTGEEVPANSVATLETPRLMSTAAVTK